MNKLVILECLSRGSRKMLKTWIPAFAGMTLFVSLSWAKPDFGIDVLRKEKFKTLAGAKVALITNHTGVDKKGESTVDILKAAKNLTLVCILTPEHGFRGSQPAGETVNDSTDAKSGLPVYSLYGEASQPTDRMLSGVDTLVFDIQDVGVRYYTYLATMGLALEAAASRGLKFVVLDRPNPLRGDVLEGEILVPPTTPRRVTGFYPIPVRHGLTAGEIARWWNETRNLNAKVQVVPIEGWKRSHWYDQTGWPFIHLSPNIRTLTAALLYAGVGAFEATNVAVGRGTDTPFEIFGAPWLNAQALCSYLRTQNFSGVLFEPIEFTPSSDLYKGELCKGVRIRITNRNDARPMTIFLAAFLFIHEHETGFKPNWKEVQIVFGTEDLQRAAEKKTLWADVEALCRTHLDEFEVGIRRFRLYP